jgi:hypothetical protein
MRDDFAACEMIRLARADGIRNKIERSVYRGMGAHRTSFRCMI